MPPQSILQNSGTRYGILLVTDYSEILMRGDRIETLLSLKFTLCF